MEDWAIGLVTVGVLGAVGLFLVAVLWYFCCRDTRPAAAASPHDVDVEFGESQASLPGTPRHRPAQRSLWVTDQVPAPSVFNVEDRFDSNRNTSIDITNQSFVEAGLSPKPYVFSIEDEFDSRRNTARDRHDQWGYMNRGNIAVDQDKRIDLHQLRVHEATSTTNDFIYTMLDIYIENGMRRDDRFIYIITGRGLHSQDGIPKIKPAVQDIIDDLGCTHTWMNKGGMVKLDLLSLLNARNNG